MDIRGNAEVASGDVAGGRKRRLGDEVLAISVSIYLALGMVFLLFVDSGSVSFLAEIPSSFRTFLTLAQLIVPWWGGIVVAAALVLIGPIRRRLWQRMLPILASIFLCGAFTMMFALIKNSLSLIVPFWADDLFSRADLALHLGYSPHDLLAWMSPLNTGELLTFYLNGWVFFATFFPVLLIAFDDNAERRNVFTLLWVGCWVGLGNVLALVFMSYGPIFTDLFPGGPANLHRSALALFDRPDSALLTALKMHLWRDYAGESGMLGSGISAFPSVHVGMATVLGLYVARIGADIARSGKLVPHLARGLVVLSRIVAGGYVAVYLVLSVYLGWHYAVDGYASILLISGGYLWLRRRAGEAADNRAVAV